MIQLSSAQFCSRCLKNLKQKKPKKKKKNLVGEIPKIPNTTTIKKKLIKKPPTHILGVGGVKDFPDKLRLSTHTTING